MTRRFRAHGTRQLLAILAVLVGPVSIVQTAAQDLSAQEQRVEIVIRDSQFLLTQPGPVRLHMPTVVIIRNQDIIRHGFTSTVLANLLVNGEGEGIATYGRGIDGFYVDAGKSLIVRFTMEKSGNYRFRCDLHPQMKGELFLFDVPAA